LILAALALYGVVLLCTAGHDTRALEEYSPKLVEAMFSDI
jgi:hypothetical protein